ncbi:hypothetical protein SEUCBS139899_007998 [Sporothrix eucalyptigena]
MACKACRTRKIKCDRTRPVCQNCRIRASHCTYAGERRQRRYTDAGVARCAGSAATSTVHSRPTAHVRRSLDMLSPLRPASDDGRPMVEPWQQQQEQQRQTPQTHHQHQPPNRSPSSHWQQPSLSAFNNDAVIDSTALLGDSVPPLFPSSGSTVPSPTSQPHSSPRALLDDILGNGGGPDNLTEASSSPNIRNPAVWMRVQDGDEYTGPSSGIAAISDVGLDWIRANAPDANAAEGLCNTIDEIRTVLLNHLRQPKCLPRGGAALLLRTSPMAPIPSRATVRWYVDTYFSSVQTVFPVLDRDEFEEQMAAAEAKDDDHQSPSWKALFFAVLASGCRAALSDETAAAFQESGRASWAYFQNALAYELLIIHHATDLTAVQALAVMTVFAQGLSSPQRLEYTLSSIAARLAQSLALHRRASPDWGLGAAEKRRRDRVFWVIYGLDKTIGLRCGRPAILQDDEISCAFPRNVVVVAAESGGERFDFFLSFIRLARICGAVARQLYSVAALCTSSMHLSSTMDQLLHDLEVWRASLPADLQPYRPIHKTKTSAAHVQQLLVLHSTYFYVLCAIYRRFTPLFTQDEASDGATTTNQIWSKVAAAHVAAARSLVLLTKHLDVESFTPGWLVFYYPMTALTSLFMHVVSSPVEASDEAASSTRNDIALMEVAVGFFGRLEYMTSGEAAFTKTTEFVRQARIITDQRMGKITTPVSRDTDGHQNSRQRRQLPAQLK